MKIAAERDTFTNPTESRPTVINRKPAYARWIAVTAGRIGIDRHSIGAGMCVLTAPAVFDQDDDGVVAPLVEEVGPDDADAARQAVALCPSGALRAVDD
jgi:ferredoxin